MKLTLSWLDSMTVLFRTLACWPPSPVNAECG